uniref:RanBP2-type domain-containing protein n=1 Tax=Physcomitrium patens TaxID=3218 RepID=A0A7I4B7V4_PHYPA
MALSCSTQILQRSWLVYFRQGTMCLVSSSANVGLRSRSLTSYSHIFRARARPSQSFLPAWRQQHRSLAFGLRGIRAMSSSSLDSAQGHGQLAVDVPASAVEEEKVAKDFNDAHEDSKVTAAASMDGEVKDNLSESVEDSPRVVLEDQVQEALCTVDLLNDGDRPELALEDDEAEDGENLHPWSEWNKYLNMLEAGGHFIFETETHDKRPMVRQEDDLGKIKRASMAFARNRDDIINVLSPELLREIAEFGCPSTDRKVVNAGKRLRVSLDIDEASVCKPCDIRNACERAYNKPSNNDAAATQDVVRLLVAYASLAKSPSRSLPAEVESAAKELLSEVIKASETPRDPSLPLPTPRAVNPPPQEKKIRRNSYTDNIDMKPGDWKCPECSFINFSRNKECRECQERRPQVELPPGDWQCPDCGFINFSRNVVCRKCQTKNTKAEIKEGDWECPRCRFHNFSRNSECYECRTERPRGTGRASDTSSSRRSRQYDRENSRSSYGRTEERGLQSYGQSDYERSSERSRPLSSRLEERSRPRDVWERPAYNDREVGRESFDRSRGAEGVVDGRRRQHEEWKPTRTQTKPSRFNFDISDGSDEDLASTVSSDDDYKELDFGDQNEDTDHEDRVLARGRGSSGKVSRGGRTDNWNSAVSRRRSKSEPPSRGWNRRGSELGSSSGDEGDFEDFEDLDFGDDDEDQDFAVSSGRSGPGRGSGRSRAPWARDDDSLDFRGFHLSASFH